MAGDGAIYVIVITLGSLAYSIDLLSSTGDKQIRWHIPVFIGELLILGNVNCSTFAEGVNNFDFVCFTQTLSTYA